MKVSGSDVATNDVVKSATGGVFGIASSLTATAIVDSPAEAVGSARYAGVKGRSAIMLDFVDKCLMSSGRVHKRLAE